MFEKEAEEYYENVTVGTFQECTENFADAVLTAYKDGAEFGYNKANEEAKEIINELLMNGYDESTRAKALDFLYPDKE